MHQKQQDETHHFKIPRARVDRVKFIFEFCRSKKILHLGFADAPYTKEAIKKGIWLHSKLSDVTSQCLGIDINSEMITWLKKHHNIQNGIVGDAEKLDQLKLGKFDVVLAGELIEHLNNPGLFLASAKKVLKPGGVLLITTTNAYCLRRFIRIPFNKESIHPDHTYYYSHRTLQCLVERFGFKLADAFSYRIRNKKPFLPFAIEFLATLITPNWGEGIVHVYENRRVKKNKKRQSGRKLI